MRVLHVTNYLPYFYRIWGGAEMACLNVINLLAEENGITQAVAATVPQEPVSGPFLFFPVETIPDRYPAPYFFFLRHYWLQKDNDVKLQMLSIMKTFQPDIVHFHNFNILTFSALQAINIMVAPALVSIYDYWFFCPTNMLIDIDNRICAEGHGFHCIGRCLYRQFHKNSHYLCNTPIATRKSYFERHLRMFDTIITLSDNSKEVVRRYGGEALNVEVVRMAIDHAPEKKAAPANSRPTALFAGWVQARKGPDMLVKAMADVVRKIADARLLVVGPLSESRFEAYIRGLTRELGLEDNVIFTGKLPKEEFQQEFNNADIVVISEQWENMSPMFMLEAMAAGKAIVSSRIGGIPEFIRDGEDGLLATHNDPADYATKMTALLSDRNRAQTLGMNARDRIAKLCDRNTVRARLLEVYKLAMQRRRIV